MTKTSRISNLKIACFSDLHFGHEKTKADFLAANFNREFPDNAATAELDLLILSGDVFDDLLMLSSEYVTHVKIWIARTLRVCKKHDIMLRVLEGTRSHDWGQSKLFPLINEISQIGADVQYVKTLSIEYIDKLGISILYIPDEWRRDPKETYSEVLDLLAAKEMSQVDFAVMHGQFEYQLPEFVKAPKHDSQAYLAIVRELIFIGHIHQHNPYDRIIPPGSFDRLSHGDERPKGHVRVTYTHDGERQIKFVENKRAKIYKTLSCIGMTPNEIQDKVEEVMKHLPQDVELRIEAEKTNPIFATFEVLMRQFPLVNWTKLPRNMEEDMDQWVPTEEEDDVYIPVSITPDNIVSLLMERLQKAEISEEMCEEAQRNLIDCISSD